MKRIFGIFILAGVLVNIGFTQSDLQKQNFQGKVSHVKETESTAQNDIHGNVAKTSQNSKCEYAFNEDGNLVRWADLDYAGNVTWYYEVEYDMSGYILISTTYNMDKTVRSYMLYTNSETGQMLSWSMYSEKSAFIYGWVCEYSPFGLMVSAKSLGRDSTNERHYVYSYDTKGNKIQEEWYNSDWQMTRKSTNKYDEKGNVILSIVYNEKNKIVGKWVQSFDSKGQVTEMNYYKSKKKLESRSTYSFDNFGNKTEEKLFDPNDNLLATWRFKYQYDSKNNWTEKTFLYNESVTKITERVIQYYE